MGGNIAVDSEVGVGSTFFFCVTFGLPESPVMMGLQEAMVDHTHRDKGNILLAEDDRTNLIAIRRLLENIGYRVVSAENGMQVLEALASESFDIILMDVQMPIMDGMEATRIIRKGGSGWEKVIIPIIAMTAYAMVGDKEKFLEAGMDDYISKPVRMDQLELLIEKVMSKRVTQ
jgi:CheY-like chemotaxis protein